MPKLKLGAALYGLAAIATTVTVVLMLVRQGPWADVHGWVFGALVAVVALSAVFLAVGAVTRRGLIADDGPWICRHGWAVLVGVTVLGFVLTLLTDADIPWLPTSPAVFIPHWIRRLQEKYWEGRVEAEVQAVRERNAAVFRAEPGGEPRSGS
ncbi:hypothetical protein [Kribbella sp. NPDC051137]|uniref:hypothetical protein n=1 Tax=Kribbella sp. NPDC051137 TaxID=3155045 RepID=UPI002F62FBBD